MHHPSHVARRPIVRLVAGVVAAAALVAACGGDDAAPASSASEPDAGPTTLGSGTEGPAEAAADGRAIDPSRELVYAFQRGYSFLDPHRLQIDADSIYLRPLYDQLLKVGRDEDGQLTPIPELATAFEFNEDSTSVVFTLRDDVTFRDGEPFNAEAVRLNMERALGPDSLVISRLPGLESVEVIDDTHVRFNLAAPDPSFAWRLTVGSVGMMVSPAALDTDLETTPMGSGPCTLVSAQRDVEVVYSCLQEPYWDGTVEMAETIRIVGVPDVTARFNGLRSGGYDISYLTPPADGQVEDLRGEGIQIHRTNESTIHGIVLNTTMAPFDDVRVRRAVSMAIDRPTISDTLFSGISVPQYQPFIESMAGYDESLNVNPYDPDAARALIEEAGAAGAGIELLFGTTSPGPDLAAIVQGALAEVGLNVTITPLAQAELRPTFRRGGVQGMVSSTQGHFDPATTLNLAWIAPPDAFEPPSPDLQSLLDAAALTSFGSPERQDAYAAVSANIVENPIHIPIAQFTVTHAAKPEVVGIDRMLYVTLYDVDFRNVGIAAE